MNIKAKIVNVRDRAKTNFSTIDVVLILAYDLNIGNSEISCFLDSCKMSSPLRVLLLVLKLLLFQTRISVFLYVCTN
jgi:hypothetical protein